jgi:hypothetical protein
VRFVWHRCRLIKHTGSLLEEKEEQLCIKVLQTLREMMSVEADFGPKVCVCIYLYATEKLNLKLKRIVLVSLLI